MSYDDDSERSHKTGRIAIFSILVAAMGLLFFLYKIEACKSSPENCKDEFYEINSGYQNSHTCSPGAVVEVVQSPPAPKPGIICHCPSRGVTPAPAVSK